MVGIGEVYAKMNRPQSRDCIVYRHLYSASHDVRVLTRSITNRSVFSAFQLQEKSKT